MAFHIWPQWKCPSGCLNTSQCGIFHVINHIYNFWLFWNLGNCHLDHYFVHKCQAKSFWWKRLNIVQKILQLLANLKCLQCWRSACSLRHDFDAESARRGRKRRGMSTQGFDCHMLHLSTGREAGTVQSMVSFGIGCYCSDYQPQNEGDNVLGSVRPSVVGHRSHGWTYHLDINFGM